MVRVLLWSLVPLLPALAAAESDGGAPAGWGEWLSQDFYHALIIPLLAATIGIAYAARPSTTDEFPRGFAKFRQSYLAVWSLCVAADWLQGPYVYALYAAYGFSGAEIAELFVAGFGSSMVFGCFVGSFTDKFGRKKTCIIYCLLYIASCITKHFKSYYMLMLGRLTGGIATSMLFSCFECWMVSEHTQRHKFSGGLLGYMFGMMFSIMYLVAILGGLAGQAVADSFTFQPISEDSIIYTGGYCAPFDLAILCLFGGMALIVGTWDENFGSMEPGGEPASLMENLKTATGILLSDSRTLLLGIIVSSFEGSMFAFVFNWTPALASERTPPPHGVIFALFMMACMCGASTSTLVSDIMMPATRLTGTFATGFLSFVLASVATASNQEDNLMLSLVAFLVFEFCVGIYFPTIGMLKSDVVPEKVRGTMYNMYRLPLNGIVVGLLLSNISMATCFKLNAFLLFLALVSMFALTSTNCKQEDYETVPKDEEEGTEMASASQPNPAVVGRARSKVESKF